MPSPGITKKILAATLKQLMKEKPLAKISVGDIVELCELNRNSFYYHFRDKYDLVNWVFYTELAETLGDGDALDSSAWTLIETLCCCLYKEKEFYQNALSVDGQNSFSEYFIQMLKTLVAARYEGEPLSDAYRDFYVSFFVDAFACAIFKWLREGAKIPPAQFADMIHKAATGAAIRILEGQEDGQDAPTSPA